MVCAVGSFCCSCGCGSLDLCWSNCCAGGCARSCCTDLGDGCLISTCCGGGCCGSSSSSRSSSRGRCCNSLGDCRTTTTDCRSLSTSADGTRCCNGLRAINTGLNCCSPSDCGTESSSGPAGLTFTRLLCTAVLSSVTNNTPCGQKNREHGRNGETGEHEM